MLHLRDADSAAEPAAQSKLLANYDHVAVVPPRDPADRRAPGRHRPLLIRLPAARVGLV